MSEKTTGTELVLTSTDLQSAQSVLQRNTEFVAKYESKSKKLLEVAEKEGTKLSPETDKAINDFLVSAKTCHTTMESDRKPFTQKMDQVKALFTAQENKLLKEIYPKLQAKRDASAKAYAEEEAERKRKEQEELDKKKELIALRADADQQIRNAYLDILQGDKNLLLNAFDCSDAATIDEVEELLRNVTPKFTQEQYDQIVPVISSRIATKEECEAIVIASRVGKYEPMAGHYAGEITNYANFLLSLIPDRRKEIESGEVSKIAEEVKQKDAEMVAGVQAQIEQETETKVSEAIAEVVIDQKINETARMASIPNSKAIQAYEITVLKREGWAEIFKFYFTHSTDRVEDMGKVKLDQMKAFAEKKAKSDGIKIESDALRYETKYKAQARKAA